MPLFCNDLRQYGTCKMGMDVNNKLLEIEKWYDNEYDEKNPERKISIEYVLLIILHYTKINNCC
jgi:hypothetical protein